MGHVWWIHWSKVVNCGDIHKVIICFLNVFFCFWVNWPVFMNIWLISICCLLSSLIKVLRVYWWYFFSYYSCHHIQINSLTFRVEVSHVILSSLWVERCWSIIRGWCWFCSSLLGVLEFLLPAVYFQSIIRWITAFCIAHLDEELLH